jgi:FKBP-type peptidyl-prolyl cis-trans isomerase SlyD
MKVAENTVVSLIYELRAENASGDIVEKVEAHQPFVFLFGANNVLPDFETNLIEKEKGNAFSFSITSENAYGDFTEEAIVNVPRSVFETDNGEDTEKLLFIGNVLTLVDQDGNPIQGKVVSANSENVVMDFNHPLAGKGLHFTGEVLDVRKASLEEISHGHVHGPGGHHHH